MDHEIEILSSRDKLHHNWVCVCGAEGRTRFDRLSYPNALAAAERAREHLKRAVRLRSGERVIRIDVRKLYTVLVTDHGRVLPVVETMQFIRKAA